MPLNPNICSRMIAPEIVPKKPPTMIETIGIRAFRHAWL